MNKKVPLSQRHFNHNKKNNKIFNKRNISPIITKNSLNKSDIYCCESW